MSKTQEEVEKLKADWAGDPHWDIEKTEGFEEHEIELLEFRAQKEAEWRDKRIARETARWEKVRALTGITDFDLAQDIKTFDEIEGSLKHATSDDVLVANVRATLLLAAQVKRIADLLENADGRDSLAETVRIWGS